MQVINAYGPTESTVNITDHHLDGTEEGPVPIGRPFANTQVYVLDAALRPVPPASQESSTSPETNSPAATTDAQP